MRNSLKISIGFIISVFFLYITFRNMQFNELESALRNADYRWLVPSQAALWLSLFARAHRFQVIAREKIRLGFWQSFSAIMVGYFGNGVLPARLGEVLKANIINKRSESSFSISIGMVFLERILDLLFMFIIFLMFLGMTLLTNEIVSEQLRKILLFGSAFAVLPFIVFFIILTKEEFFNRLFNRFIFFFSAGFKEKLSQMLKRFLEASHSIKDPVFLAKILLISFLVWLPIIYNSYFLFLSFEGLKALPLRAAMLTVMLIAIGIALPSSPGYIGPYHAAAKYALIVYTSDLASIGSYAIVLHLSQMIPMVFVGFIFFNKENLSIKHNRDNKVRNEG